MLGVRALGLSAAVATIAVVGSGCGQSTRPGGPTIAVSPSATASAASSPTALPPVTPAPTPASFEGDLKGVACVSSSDCWAVGAHGTGTLVEHYNGASWIEVPSANAPAPGLNALQAVTCVDATDCWAVGSSRSVSAPLIEHSIGGNWSIVASPNPPNADMAQLVDVACVSATDCLAVGQYSIANAGTQALVEQNTGHGWTSVGTPILPGGQEDGFAGVTCVDASDCWAVGGSWLESGGGQPLIEHNAGRGWTVVETPSSAVARGPSLASVACASARECWAVGGGAAGAVLIEQYSGASWNVVTEPTPSADGRLTLNGVTCVGGDACWAVGGSNFTDSPEAFIERTTGSGWTLVPSADPNSDAWFGAVSCVTASECWAVGSTDHFGGVLTAHVT